MSIYCVVGPQTQLGLFKTLSLSLSLSVSLSLSRSLSRPAVIAQRVLQEEVGGEEGRQTFQPLEGDEREALLLVVGCL